jgi:class 3 adenylate cyclase
MQEATRSRLRRLAVLVAVGALAGMLYMPFISDVVSVATALRFAAQGALIILLTFGFEIFIGQGAASEPLRRAPFAVVLFAKALILTSLIVIAYVIGGLLLFPERFEVETPLFDLARDTGYALMVALMLEFMLMIRNLIGGRVLTNILLGRYHKPLNEERIFMFLDVRDSTALAETAGGIGAYSMISRFFFDVAQETTRFGGDTHEYIGDEVVVTWPLDSSRRNGRCLECYFAICDRLDRKARLYQREFGTVPKFRVSLHGGPIVAGECGDDKREIVYFGDTINTTARMQEMCKETGRSLLMSGELLRRMELKPGYSTVALGEVKLRGRVQPIELYSIERTA